VTCYKRVPDEANRGPPVGAGLIGGSGRDGAGGSDCETIFGSHPTFIEMAIVLRCIKHLLTRKRGGDTETVSPTVLIFIFYPVRREM
jgi:hypothetical protein